MAEETKVGMKLDMELEPIKEMCKKLEEAVKHELSKGIENVDAKELGEVVDMIKDLYEAKEKLVKACYYKQIMEAMEEHDFDDEEEIMDEGRKGYRGRSRDSMGRFTSRRGRGGRRGYEEPMMYDEDWEDMEYMRDMDRQYGRMGYSGSGSSGGNMGGSRSGQSSSGMSGGSMGSQGGSRVYSDGGRGQSSRSESARRGYEESKMMQDGSPESKKKAMESLESYLKELSEDMTDLVSKMDANEKSMVKNKLQVLAQKVS